MDRVVAPIAICSLSCRYADARSPDELWANLMDGRRSFRPIPPERLAMRAYTPGVIGLVDSITPVLAGLLTNWRFDREAFLIPKPTFDSADLTHWLALELAAEAIEAVGGMARLHRARTAVVVGNTLTGEFSRAALLRLRQPFLDELLSDALDAQGTTPDMASRIRSEFAERLRSRFSEPTEDSLAGGLANTIAGRIANYFDLKGGAYIVDGACSSSLLAVANAASLLQNGTVDAVITGAVDLSLDPFELIGFSRNGALSPTRMRVFDERSNGFWPGEGGAFSVLMRADDARRWSFPVQAVMRGWGLSTDGAGGLTRPDSNGQLLAYRRAYEASGTDPGDVGYVEAHGTGTAVGDPTEITALAALREGAERPLPVGSVKANIGHTKAAAGFAGLIKAVLSLKHGCIPPHPACEKPHAIFRETDGRVYPVQQATAYGAGTSALAGVSSFGFGGINLHVVLELAQAARRPAVSVKPPKVRGEPGVELFLFHDSDALSLLQQLTALRHVAATLSLAELGDAAAYVAKSGRGIALRLAFVAHGVDDLCERLDEAINRTERGELRPSKHLFFGSGAVPERIGYLFSGQAAPVRNPSAVWSAFFPFLAPLAPLGEFRDGETDTSIAQPAITYANLAALQVMNAFTIRAAAATGHSLGEIAALAWAGSVGLEQALDLAVKRGALMGRHGEAGGAMALLALSPAESAQLIGSLNCTIACLNGLGETVLSGRQEAINECVERARRKGVSAHPLKVSHAFHSPDMLPVVEPFRAVIRKFAFAEPLRPLISTVTGHLLNNARSPADELCEQLVRPVQFVSALNEMAKHASLFIELGPGSSLARLANAHGLRALSVDSQSDDLAPLFTALAALFAAGHHLDLSQLFSNRGIRPFKLDKSLTMLSNPCGSRRSVPDIPQPIVADRMVSAVDDAPPLSVAVSADAVLQITLAVVAGETGLPVSAISPNARFQSDLHLNSLAVTRIVFAVCKQLGRQVVRSPTDFSEATPAFLTSQVVEMAEFPSEREDGKRVNGIRRWATSYGMVWHACSLPAKRSQEINWSNNLWAAAANSARNKPGLVLKLRRNLEQEDIAALVTELQQAQRLEIKRLAVIHDGSPLSSFFRSLSQEEAFESIQLIDRNGVAEAEAYIQDILARATPSFAEYRLTVDGGVESPAFERLSLQATKPAGMPRSDDLVLAVGCHRGIGTECAFSLASNGARIIFVGRSAETEPAVAETLALARSRGISASYERCDVTDQKSVQTLARHLGAAALVPTILLFAPATNQPTRFSSLSPESVRATLSPKVDGLRNVFHSFGDGFRQVIAFGSLIGRIGLQGECHYAAANAMQSSIVEQFSLTHASCRCLVLEWTVWSGAGMGERLGTIERLAANGVDALPFNEAIAAFEQYVTMGFSGTVSITGRFGPPAGLDIGSSAKPPYRFLDTVLVDFPGTELIVETELNLGRDPYLADHCVNGRAVLPGVVAMEAMGQVANTLMGNDVDRRVTDVIFHRAVIVENRGLRIRIAALRSDNRQVEVAVFTEDDEFQSTVASARLHRADNKEGTFVPPRRSDDTAEESTNAMLLYDTLFFHGPLFQRLGRLISVSSRSVDVTLRDRTEITWFGAFEPRELFLGDPSVADAALHALQATIPHRRVLPLSIGEFSVFGNLSNACRIIGAENWTQGNVYSFDIDVLDGEGILVAAWKDVRFRAIAEIPVEDSLKAVPLLCRPYLERLAREQLGDDVVRISLVLDRQLDEAQRRDRAIKELAMDSKAVWRADGRPMLLTRNGFVGFSHTGPTSLAVYGSIPVACDIAELDGSYPGQAGRGLSAEDWAAAEVLRKLEHPEPFAAMHARNRARGPLPPAPVVFTRVLPALGVAVAVGCVRGAVSADNEHARSFVEVAQ
ncbi:type I polyketide synthase [Sinorhizobium meliloti]|nr:type I polyketide synthase [Sinorhizobium meliloti]MDE3858111.1 SDR family NAD(P)-dependent oxidoreductase [Sinorhizobium meliloti]